MKIKRCLKLEILILAVVLLFGIAGCKGADKTDNSSATITSQTDIGEGEKEFTFTVEADGEKKVYSVNTDKETVGEALLELKLISGEQGDYGLYVKEVDGISADYDKDKAYWAFYVNGEYATSGVDKTEIKEGESYAFKKEKS